MKRVIVIPDLQIPLHDSRLVTEFINFIEDYQPDELYCVGDEFDAFEISRWDKGTSIEMGGTYQKNIDKTFSIMARFRAALGYNKPFHIMRSNHGETRVRSYLKTAPALETLRALDYPTLMGYRDLKITYHNRLWEFAPGWLLAHGDEGSMSQQPGGTAMRLASKTGKSVVCGHSHKAGLQHAHTGFNGLHTQKLYGMEVGHMMDMSKAVYLPANSGNWQQAFGILYIDRNKVTPNLINVNNRSFIVEGHKYNW
jgi:UDP-2,3-diacylglucosamine pyrophosphatase LpxH